MSSAPIDLFLQRVEKPVSSAPGQYRSRCPACGGNRSALSFREAENGAVLVHCFKGCTVEQVAQAAGLQLQDLFPPSQKSGREPRRTPPVISPRHALELLETESTLIAVAGANIGHGVKLSRDDMNRVLAAAGRVAWLRQLTEATHA